MINNKQIVLAAKKMVTVRCAEEKCAALYLAKKIAGFCHLYIGQEAIIGGLALVMGSIDTVITGYRAHGFMYLRSDDIENTTLSLVGELMGKSIGCSKGKGGSMHIFDTQRGFYGGHGIVGAQVPLGTGLALAHKYKGDGGVCFTLFGDGAANQGQVAEAFNMAALWGLPVVYIIENNQYAMGTSVARGSASPELYRRGEPFGIKGVQVNGMDLVAVHEALDAAATLCREESRPLLLEIMTYRYRGHSMSDPAKYRSRDEVDHYRNNKDPIDGVKTLITKRKIMSSAQWDEMESNIKIAIERAIDRCEAALEPDASELTQDVYVP